MGFCELVSLSRGTGMDRWILLVRCCAAGKGLLLLNHGSAFRRLGDYLNASADASISLQSSVQCCSRIFFVSMTNGLL